MLEISWIYVFNVSWFIEYDNNIFEICPYVPIFYEYLEAYTFNCCTSSVFSWLCINAASSLVSFLFEFAIHVY
jgi:hypothetical protein